MIRFVYNLLWPIGLLLFLPRYLVKMFRRGGYRNKFGQRLGFYSADVRKRLGDQRSIWLHAVSVGEVAIALKLASALRGTRPDAQFALTTTTTTGFAFAEANAPSWIEVMYSPLDFWPIMRRAFATIQPERIALVEAEVWPNLVVQAHRRRIPIALVNARLSPRSERRFLRFRTFVRPMFRLLDLICVQEPEDIERWTAIIGESDGIEYTGSIKYDTGDQGNTITAKPADASRMVLLGGSTHAGEEEALARIFLGIRSRFPALSLFIAPRHVERARQVRKQLEALSLKVRFVSEGVSDSLPTPDCVVLDKTGELQKWYGIASVAFIGKSLLAHGGQNPVEAIVAGVPVVFGPHMENFAMLARELIAHDAAIQVSDEAGLEQAVAKLLGDPALRSRLVANAENVLARHRGATARTAKLFVDLNSRA